MKSAFFIALFFSRVVNAQAPFANLFWEASDGGEWTRNALTTTQRNMQVRLVAEWGASGAFGFGGTAFDVVISSVEAGDAAANFQRPAPFAFSSSTPAAFRQGNVIKLDDIRDSDAPGIGPYWIQVGQDNGTFGGQIDPVNPAILFRFDLLLADSFGTRQVNSIPIAFPGPPPYNTLLWAPGGASIRVFAPVVGVNVTHVPLPGSLTILGCVLVLARRCR